MIFMECKKKELAREITEDCTSIAELHEIIKDVFAECLEEMMKKEFDQYLKILI